MQKSVEDNLVESGFATEMAHVLLLVTRGGRETTELQLIIPPGATVGKAATFSGSDLHETSSVRTSGDVSKPA